MVKPMAAITEPQVDGRRARRHRSRDLAVDALLDLLDEGVVRPTAQQVAERSGVSLRSIFRIFDDVESLNAAASVLGSVGALMLALYFGLVVTLLIGGALYLLALLIAARTPVTTPV